MVKLKLLCFLSCEPSAFPSDKLKERPAMSKTSLVLSSVDDKGSMLLNSGSSMQDGVVTIPKILYFKIPVGANPRDYSDLDVYSHTNFPQVKSALTDDPRFKFYGNATVSRETPDSKYFRAELEYSSSDPSATDSDGGGVTSATAPWRLRPDNINFTYPETTVTFQMSYDESGKNKRRKGVDKYGNETYEPTVPVVNSAGDPLVAETTQRNMHLSFTFASSNWSEDNAFKFGNSVNSSSITVCGLKIPEKSALLLPPECSYITVYRDNSTIVKWQYWSVTINILIDLTGDVVTRKLLNIGDRATFPSFFFQDDLLDTYTEIPPTTTPSYICKMRKAVSSGKNADGKDTFAPMGDVVFLSFDQFVAIRQMYIAKTSAEQYAPYDAQFEQLTQMPLVARGSRAGMLDVDAANRQKPYDVLSFREFPYKNWSSLDLPKKGIKW